MYLTKINKLIWIVFLLPCIQAQINEFTFGPDTHTYVNVSVSYDVKLICIAAGNVAIGADDTIVLDFILTDHSIYSYTYDDTDRNRVIHVLTIKYTARDAIQSYKCANNDFLYVIHLKPYYPPARPTCTTTQDSDTIKLTCRSEKGNPRVSMSIYDSDKTYPTHNELEYVNTHFSRSTFLTEYKENIKCVTTYNFIQNNTVYTTKYICTFNDIATIKPAITNSTLNVDNQPISSSTIHKYSVLTLAMAILSRTI